MPTAAERQALAFLAGVALLGGGAQVWRNRSIRVDAQAAVVTGAETVDAQLHAVDSARSAKSLRKRTSKKSAVQSNDESGTASRKAVGATQPPMPLLIDIDVATVEELEKLPRVGPALAQRIVANRDSLGAFGSLQEFGRVRGVGPAMLKLLEPVTMFSGRVRDRTVRRHDRD